jgi:hypothetical protein
MISLRKASASGELAAARGESSASFKAFGFQSKLVAGVDSAASLPCTVGETIVCSIVDLTLWLDGRN